MQCRAALESPVRSRAGSREMEGKASSSRSSSDASSAPTSASFAGGRATVAGRAAKKRVSERLFTIDVLRAATAFALLRLTRRVRQFLDYSKGTSVSFEFWMVGAVLRVCACVHVLCVQGNN